MEFFNTADALWCECIAQGNATQTEESQTMQCLNIEIRVWDTPGILRSYIYLNDKESQLSSKLPVGTNQQRLMQVNLFKDK